MNRILKNRGFVVSTVNALSISLLLTFDWQRPIARVPYERQPNPASAIGAAPKQAEDPCERLPEARGRAEGHERKCRGGSSNGISRADFNGDGFADLAVGAPGKDTPANVASSGAVFVIYGSSTGLRPEGGTGIPPTQFWSQNTEGVPGTSEAGDNFGSAVAAGEFNADSYSDLVVGIDGEDSGGFEDTGRVVVIYGSPSGLTATDPGIPAAQTFDFGDVGGLRAEDHLGSVFAWGDFNGDTVGDLAIGASQRGVFPNAPPPGLIPEAGVVWVIYGTYPNGLALDKDEIVSQLTPGADFNPDTPESNDHFGAVLAAGDFNGDRFTDLAVAAPDEDFQGVKDVGLVHVFEGRDTGFFQYDNSRLVSLDDFRNVPEFIGLPEENDEFGTSMAAGDFDRDGKADLVIGAPRRDIGGTDDAGVVFLLSSANAALGVLGTKRLFDQGNLFANGRETFDKFGIAMAVGDFNGDGFVDLAIGVPFEDILRADGQTIRNAGEVNVVYGSTQGLRTGTGQAQRFLQGAGGVEGTLDEEDRFGTSLSAWNFGRNLTLRDTTGQLVTFLTADLAIGVPFEDLFSAGNGVLQEDAGAIHVLYGGLAGLTSANDQFLHQENIGGFANRALDRFGRFLY